MKSVEHNNRRYAPGFSTYGKQGRMGTSGKDGNTLYLCNTSLYEDGFDVQELMELRKKVLENLNNSRFVDGTMRVNKRGYMLGDYLVDIGGRVFSIIEYSGIEAYEFDISQQPIMVIGGIEESPFHTQGGLLSTNDFINKLFVFSGIQDKELRDKIISDKTHQQQPGRNASHKIFSKETSIDPKTGHTIHPFQSFCVYDELNDVVRSLDIYYDENIKSFVFRAENPILIDAPAILVESQKIGSGSDNVKLNKEPVSSPAVDSYGLDSYHSCFSGNIHEAFYSQLIETSEYIHEEWYRYMDENIPDSVTTQDVEDLLSPIGYNLPKYENKHKRNLVGFRFRPLYDPRQPEMTHRPPLSFLNIPLSKIKPLFYIHIIEDDSSERKILVPVSDKILSLQHGIKQGTTTLIEESDIYLNIVQSLFLEYFKTIEEYIKSDKVKDGTRYYVSIQDNIVLTTDIMRK